MESPSLPEGIVADPTNGAARSGGVAPSALNLFLSGFVVLFLELACIRWFAVYVVFMQFFTNIILIACFLGMSVGCLCAGKKEDWLARFPRLVAWTATLAIATNAIYTYWHGLAIDVGGQSMPQVIFFGTEYRVDIAKFVIPMEVPAGIFFVLIALMFVGPGQVLGKLFDAYPNRVIAYTANIAGSLAGVAAFAVVSFTGWHPVVWFAISFGVIVLFLKQCGTLKREALAFLAITLVAVVIPENPLRKNKETQWSPYYAVEYDGLDRSIRVNGVGHQRMVAWDAPSSEYSLIHFLNRDAGGPPFDRALIIGAGSGNDVAHSLAAGVGHVDAVEIDPVIQRLGQQHHPDQPYADERVDVYLNDGRNFLKTTENKYDLVIFALVDSLILHSSYSSVRLESFLFTDQAFRDVQAVLRDDGIFVTYNFFRRGWLVQRIAAMLEQAFGSEPLVLSLPHVDEIRAQDEEHGRLTIFIVGAAEHIRAAFDQHQEFWMHRTCATSEGLNGYEHRPAGGEEQWWRLKPARVIPAAEKLASATDDWPFLYLHTPTIPRLYVRSMVIIGILGLGLLVWLSPGHRIGLNGRMFFLGAGFLLLETKAVVQLALIFGSTWLVNSLVFFTILVMILGSNLYVLKKGTIKLRYHYAALIVSLLANCAIPMDVFLAGPFVWKYVTPCVLSLIPVFFAGVIFMVSFRESQQPDRDFGANIAGAVVGGLAEYSSMALGFRYLLLVAVVFYLLSAVFRPKVSRS